MQKSKTCLVEPYLKQAMVDQGRICDDYFHVDETLPLIGKDDLQIKRPVVLCKDVPEFINFVKETRYNGKNFNDKNFIHKIGLDGGKGSFKVTLNLIETSENLTNAPVADQIISEESNLDSEQAGPSTSSSVVGLARSVHLMISSESESETETPASFCKKVKKSKYLDSGVKQLFILALAPDTKESYVNLKLILDTLKVFESNDDFSIPSDKKLYSILLGIQSHSSTYPCI